MPPNTALQRTRSSASPPCSPLSFKPLGAIVISLVAIAALGAGQPEVAILELEQAGGLCESWRVAIYSSGHANEWSMGGCESDAKDGSRLWPISPKQLQAIRSALESAKLEDLPSVLEPETVKTDETYLIIRWSTKAGTKAIRASGLDRLKDRGIAARFMSVWKAVTVVVPEPR
jgi:hypothetical protein